MFYINLTRNEFEKSSTLFSTSFYEATNKEELKYFLETKQEKLGNFVDYSLEDWKTHRVTGTNPESTYLLFYKVKYSKNTVIEKFTLKSEKGIVKICGYDVGNPLNKVPF